MLLARKIAKTILGFAKRDIMQLGERTVPGPQVSTFSPGGRKVTLIKNIFSATCKFTKLAKLLGQEKSGGPRVFDTDWDRI
jgi:hypothetical protein